MADDTLFPGGGSRPQSGPSGGGGSGSSGTPNRNDTLFPGGGGRPRAGPAREEPTFTGDDAELMAEAERRANEIADEKERSGTLGDQSRDEVFNDAFHGILATLKAARDSADKSAGDARRTEQERLVYCQRHPRQRKF